MSTIQRIPTGVALPLTVNNNEYYFDVSNQNGQIDHQASYQELEMNLYDASGAVVTNYRNIVFGQDGLLYNASALFRIASLVEARTNKKYQELTYVNILSNNLEYFTKGINNIKADALFNGQGVVGSDGSVLSVFNNQYPDKNPVVYIPLSILYPGDLGSSEMFPQEDDLTYRYFLETQYPVFMRAVDSNKYSNTSSVLGASKDFEDANAGELTLTASALGELGDLAVGDEVLVTFTDGTVKTAVRTLTVVTPDGTDPGSITFVGPLSANAITDVSVQKFTITVGSFKCNPTSTTKLTLVTPTPANVDVYKNTQIVLSYIDASGNLQSMDNKIASLDAIDASGNIPAINLVTPLPSASVTQLSFVPLYTNLNDFTWSVLSANLVLYRKMRPSANPESLLMSSFESKNVQVVAGLDKFSYDFKTPVNGYNTYVLMPNSTNLYSQLPEYGSYKYTVNEQDLTTIYIPLKDNVLHKDNMVRVLSNSLTYLPQNLSKDKMPEISSEIYPEMVPGKIFQSQIKGDILNVQDMMLPDNNVKVELFTSAGQSTTAKNVYLFVEKFMKV